MVYFVTAFTAAIVVLYVLQGITNGRKESQREKMKAFLNDLARGTTDPKTQGKYRRPHEWMSLLDAWVELVQSINPDTTEQSRVTGFFIRRKAEMFCIRRLRSKSVFMRCRSAHYLGYLRTERTVKALSLSLKQERKEPVKLYIINALARLEAGVALPDIIDSIRGCSPEFIKRVTGLIIDFQSSFIALFPQLESRRDAELTELLVEYARLAPYKNFAAYLRTLLGEPTTPQELREKVFCCLVQSYPYAIQPMDYTHDDNPAIRNRAFEAIGERPGKANALFLLEAAQNVATEGIAVANLSNMARHSAEVFMFLLDLLERDANSAQVPILSRVLSGRIDYFLLKTGTDKAALHEKVIEQVLASGKLSDLISFLNDNHDSDIENRIVKVIQKHLSGKSSSIRELRMYLKPDILNKIGLDALPLPQKRISENKEGVKRGPLVAILVVTTAAFPLLVLHARFLADALTWKEAIFTAMNRYTNAFAWYAFALTSFYFFLAFCAKAESRMQNRFLRIKDNTFLFQKNILPSISILAPAYNEEVNITNSVESLLNVNYPDFEVIVINDGSKDKTLSQLIDHFKLEKTDSTYIESLKTQPVRGIYHNPRIPALKVIDKINGGKADSLNVGINAASGEYVLGIDSDSILERDSLLILTSAFLDEEKPVVASGGNIMPANGCEIESGILVRKRVPRKAIPLVQTVEYLRSFMNGRMGWSRLRTLMIISGAFGLFRRKEVLEIKGYLTSREKYEKDTVGEDMELVVRMGRHMRERKLGHRILYNCRANCWTEVPETLKILKRQRDRWQRGLIDIISFHKKMVLNPKYGTFGLFGFPYYIAFEIIGPWFELYGTVVFIAGLALGIFGMNTILFLLATNFLYSFALSLYSLHISDTDRPIFPLADRLLVVFASLFETLGFHQVFAFFRITGFVGVLRRVKGWGAMPRKGIGQIKR